MSAEIIRGDAWRGRDFTGKRVAVLASGPETAKIVPELVRTASFVKVFQDRPQWVLPRQVPVAPLRRAAARLHLRLRVRDSWTRRLLTPHTRFGSRRVAVSAEFYAALARPNCKLIAWPVYAIVAGGVRTAEGIEHQADYIVDVRTAA